jgi:hypothetical protein
MLRARVVVVALGAAFGAIGLAVSYLIAPPLGAPHHCPSGSRPTDCHYSPDRTSWSIWWTIGGLVVGLCLGLLAAQGLQHRSVFGRASIRN